MSSWLCFICENHRLGQANNNRSGKKGHHLNIVSCCHVLQEFESGSMSLTDSGLALSVVYLCIQCLSHPKSAHGYLCIFCLGGGLIAFEETCTLSFQFNLTKSVSSLELYLLNSGSNRFYCVKFVDLDTTKEACMSTKIMQVNDPPKSEWAENLNLKTVVNSKHNHYICLKT